MAKKSRKPGAKKVSRTVPRVMSPEEIAAVKTALWGGVAPVPPPPAPPAAAKAVAAGQRARLAVAAAKGPTLVAEGDSWFDYLPGLDILDNLRLFFGYPIVKLSQAGDTLENMVFGTALGRDDTRLPVQLDTLVATVSTYQPRAVLFSGGGNDVAGEPLEAYLNHKDSDITPLLREGYMNEVIDGLFRSAYEKLAASVWAVRPETHIITHGYGHPIPDGRAVFNFSFGFRFIGPWLKPAFSKKDILDLATATGIMARFIDKFNDMLKNLQTKFSANAQGKLHYIDLRPDIRPADWVNELHLSNAAYKRVAARFDAVIKTL